MNRELVDKLARALLYEGYILYPYRPSVKNRQRWSFGGIYPRAWSDMQSGTDAWTMQTECLVAGQDTPVLRVLVRFLHLTDRIVGKLPNQSCQTVLTGDEPEYQPVELLEVGQQQYRPWQEAEEREIDAGEFNLLELSLGPRRIPFSYPRRRAIEHVSSPTGEAVGVLVREQQPIDGAIELSAADVAPGLRKITVKILNLSAMDQSHDISRDDALMGSLISTHTVLSVREGDFVSLLEPPEEWERHARACQNIGAWPVLVGTGTERDTMLSSPIILYDYPQLAKESPGDLFDSTEIDEILTLRIMTLTDDEKRQAASTDERVRELLVRTESLAREQLMGLHGIVRAMQPVTAENKHG